MGRNEITVEIYERDEIIFLQSTISTAIIILMQKTYDPEFSMISPEGKKPDFCRWAGGWQTYICASQSPLYLRRNFTELFRQGIQLEGTYLDVFTCNEPDECALHGIQ